MEEYSDGVEEDLDDESSSSENFTLETITTLTSDGKRCMSSLKEKEMVGRSTKSAPGGQRVSLPKGASFLRTVKETEVQQRVSSAR